MAKTVDELLLATAKPQPTRTDRARELILDLLERDGDQESDALDALVAAETGLARNTVKNARLRLKDEGFVKHYAERDEFGSFVCWKVGRTGAPRP